MEDPFIRRSLESTEIRKEVKTYYKNKSAKYSEYRGASRNCSSSWQAACKIGGKQEYIGSFEDKEVAALIYDIVSI